MASMRLLDRWSIHHGESSRTIELLQGDLAYLPPEHAVEILVVSAFANDYTPTYRSLIGSLAYTGLNVAELANDKAVDLREQYSCWMSKPVSGQFAFKRILCIESGWRGSPPEIADDLFRALAPYLLTECPDASVAMPLIGAGDQGWPPAQMLDCVVTTAVAWIRRGLALRLLKVVVFSERDAIVALQRFQSIRAEYGSRTASAGNGPAPTSLFPKGCDVFLSYLSRGWRSGAACETRIGTAPT